MHLTSKNWGNQASVPKYNLHVPLCVGVYRKPTSLVICKNGQQRMASMDARAEIGGDNK